MSKQLSFRCPVCEYSVTRGGEAYLEMAVAAHILQHEEKAALVAVDRARLSCPETTCSIGRRSNHFNKSIGSPELVLSDFDKSWLAGMKISQD